MNFFAISSLDSEKRKQLESYLFYENIARSRLFAKIVMIFESILIALNLLETYHLYGTIFHLNAYLLLYMILFSLSVATLLYIRLIEKRTQMSREQWNWYRFGLLALVAIFLVWGAVVSLLDQRSYGHVMAFVVNFMCVSILFHASSKVMLTIYTPAIVVLYVGLPVFQSSSSVLFGHYVNLTVFLVFCWLASRMLYKSNSTSFINELLLTEANERLANKISENEVINGKLRELAILDELTKIPNRRGFNEYMEIALHSRHQMQQLTILMIDIDAFKAYNDYYGHLKGDATIQQVARIIRECTNGANSVCARFGGEEFIVAIFTGTEEKIGAIAEKIRASVQAEQIPHRLSPVDTVVTVSIGIARKNILHEEELRDLIDLADRALYISKSQGRNQVCFFQETLKR